MTTYDYRGYTIAVTDKEAAVVCRVIKEKCIPFGNKEAAEICVDSLIDDSLKESMFDLEFYPLEITTHEGYKIVVVSKKTALVVCKKLKGSCIPYFTKEAAQRGAHHLKTRISKEGDYVVWDTKIFGLN